ADSIYSITRENHVPIRLTVAEKRNMITFSGANWNLSHTACVYEKNGDIFYKDFKTGRTKTVIETSERESAPQFSFDDKKIVFTKDQNLFAWDIASGELTQITNLVSVTNQNQGERPARGAANKKSEPSADSLQAAWLEKDQLQYLQVLRKR